MILLRVQRTGMAARVLLLIAALCGYASAFTGPTAGAFSFTRRAAKPQVSMLAEADAKFNRRFALFQGVAALTILSPIIPMPALAKRVGSASLPAGEQTDETPEERKERKKREREEYRAKQKVGLAFEVWGARSSEQKDERITVYAVKISAACSCENDQRNVGMLYLLELVDSVPSRRRVRKLGYFCTYNSENFKEYVCL